MLDKLKELLKINGKLSGLIIDEAADCPSSSMFRSRFGSLLKRPGLGEVVVEPGDEVDGGPVLEAGAGGEGVLGPGVEGQQQGLAGTDKILC